MSWTSNLVPGNYLPIMEINNEIQEIYNDVLEINFEAHN